MQLSNPDSKTPTQQFEAIADKIAKDDVANPTTQKQPATDPIETIQPTVDTPATKEEPSTEIKPVVEQAPIEKLPTPEDRSKLSTEEQEYLKTFDEPVVTTKKETVTDPADTTSTQKVELDAETKTRLSDYEQTLNDPLVKAVAEFRKKGGTDITALAKELGIVDASTLSIKDLYAKQAQALGLKDEQLTEAVEEQIAKFDSLTTIEKKEIENTLRVKEISNQAERLKTFAIDSEKNSTQQRQADQTARQETAQAATLAKTKIEESVQQLVGKKWKGLPITEELGKAIQEQALELSRPLYDKTGKFLGYETEDAIEFAIWKATGNGRALLKANLDLGRNLGFEKAITERNRPNANDTTAAVISAKSRTDEADEAIRAKIDDNNKGLSLSNPKK